ncbi:MAG TPA: hypothetical protein DHW42_11565 [Candidatus Marinimicrobia bacterium]|nr:hypothetical protein [Candidatus Neomarinimicrobiota bacterium]
MKRKKISRNKKKNLIMLALFSFLVGSMVLYVWIFNYTNILYKEVDKLRREEANLVTQNRIASVELERLSRADRIINIAMSEINMCTPAPETLAVVINH